MKDSIINYNDEYSIQTELVTALPSGIVIFKATIQGESDTVTAHASGFPSASGSINDIEAEAVNRAFSLTKMLK